MPKMRTLQEVVGGHRGGGVEGKGPGGGRGRRGHLGGG